MGKALAIIDYSGAILQQYYQHSFADVFPD